MKGRIITLDTVNALKAAAQDTTIVEITSSDWHGQIQTTRIECVDNPAEGVSKALAQAQAATRHVLAVNTLRPTSEDVFVKATGLSAEAMWVETGEKGQSHVGG